jgi:hypothetical protein
MYTLIKTPHRTDRTDRNDLMTIKITLPDDIGAVDLGSAFEAFMLACGYHPETVEGVFNQDE